MQAKIPEEDQPSVSEAAVVAVAASPSHLEEGRGPNWRPNEEFDPQGALEVIKFSQQCVITRGKRRPAPFAHDMQSIIRTGLALGAKIREDGIEAFWRRNIDDPNAFSPAFWQLFLQSNLTALGEKYRPVCVGMTWGRLLAAGTTLWWRSQLEETNREARDSLESEYEGGLNRYRYAPGYITRRKTG